MKAGKEGKKRKRKKKGVRGSCELLGTSLSPACLFGDTSAFVPL